MFTFFFLAKSQDLIIAVSNIMIVCEDWSPSCPFVQMSLSVHSLVHPFLRAGSSCILKVIPQVRNGLFTNRSSAEHVIKWRKPQVQSSIGHSASVSNHKWKAIHFLHLINIVTRTHWTWKRSIHLCFEVAAPL